MLTDCQRYSQEITPWQKPKDGIGILLEGEHLLPHSWLHLKDDRARTNQYQGRLESTPDLFTDIELDDFLDRWLCRKEVGQFSKIQRHWLEDQRIETLSRIGGRWLWRQGKLNESAPDGETVTSLAVEHLIQQLTTLQAKSARLLDEDSELGPAVFKLAVRLEPLETSVDTKLVRFEDTMRVELQWTLHRNQQQWWARDLSGQLAYQLSDQQAEQLMAPLSQRPITPLVPAAVIGISYRDQQQTWRLRQQDNGWQIFHQQVWQAADGDAVSKYLHDILSWQMSAQQSGSELPAFAYQPASRGQQEAWINGAQAEIELFSGSDELMRSYRLVLGADKHLISASLPPESKVQLPARIRIDQSHRRAQRPSAYFLPVEQP